MNNSTSIFVNLPVTDLQKSTAFYQALGFTKNEAFSNEMASSLQWSDNIFLMILTQDFYTSFLQGKTVADTQKTSGALLCLQLDSKETVQKFADTAKQNGGNFYRSDITAQMPEDAMFGYEVEDPDGNIWEPMWMNPNFVPPEG